MHNSIWAKAWERLCISQSKWSSWETSSVGYLGPDTGSAVSLVKQMPVLLALLAIFYGAWIEVSPEVVWEGAGTRFPHSRDVWMKSGKFANRSAFLRYFV